jgi:hypothetical protein
MVPFLWRGRTPALLAAALLLATASASGGDKADPLNPRAEVPALRHDSALATYRRLGENEALGWKNANDAAQRIGGWRAYAREAAAPASAAASASPSGSAR